MRKILSEQKNESIEISDNDEKIIGIDSISEKLRLSFLDLNTLRLRFGLPMKKEQGGVFVIYKKDLSAWLKKHALELSCLNVAAVEAAQNRRKIDLAAMKDETLIGGREISDFMQRSFISLISWRESHRFPLTRQNGLPVVKITDLKKWVDAHGGDLNSITSDSLYRDHLRSQAENTEARELSGIKEIAEFARVPISIALSWFREYDSFPGKKVKDNFSVNSKELLFWIAKNNIKRGGGTEFSL